MRYTPEQIERVRESTNIVELISKYVQLKKKGRNYFGLCPFHNEKSPSFSVLEEKGIFKCFGCGKGGDVFRFIMEFESLSFAEAIEKLAAAAGITLEARNDKERDRDSERESMLGALREAATWYYQRLRSSEGTTGWNYLQARGFSQTILKTFGVGLANAEPGLLTHDLESKGFSLPTLVAAGIVFRSERGEHFERFRNRIIFPVFSSTGKIVGFGGRIYSQNSGDAAKYINSPDTSVYHKSEVVYGLYQAKDAIRKQDSVILVEGYADVLALSQAGFTNVVAASGTSLTPGQLNLLKRYTSSLILTFDADQAGKNAAMRGLELAIAAGFDVNTVLLPNGEDPDSYIRKHGADAFSALITRRQSFIETKAQLFEDDGYFNDPAKSAIAIRSIVDTIRKVPDKIKQELFIRRVATRFRIQESTLNAELKSTGRTRSFNSRVESPFRESQNEEPPEIAKSVNPATNNLERSFLEALLEAPVQVLSQMEDYTSLDLIKDESIKRLVDRIINGVEKNDEPSVSQLLSEFRDEAEMERLLIDLSSTHTMTSERWDEESEDNRSTERAIDNALQALAGLERIKLEQEQEEIRRTIQRMQPDELEAALVQSHFIAQRLDALRETEMVKVVGEVTGNSEGDEF